MRALIVILLVAGSAHAGKVEDAAAVWRKAQPSTIRQGLDALQRSLGLRPLAVARLAGHDPALQRAVLGTLRLPSPPPPPPKLSAQRARALPINRAHIADALARPGSPLMAELISRLRTAEAQGTPDGKLLPSDLDGADPVIRDLVRAIYGRVGSRSGMTMTLAQLEAALPEAVGALLRGKTPPGRHFDAVYVGAMTETLAMLSERYHREVTTGGDTATHFAVRHVLQQRGRWQVLTSAFPQLFPAGRSQAEQLVVTAILPRPTRAASGQNTPHPDELVALVGARATRMVKDSPLTERQDVVDALNADPAFVARYGRMDVTRYANLSGKAKQEGDYPEFRNQARSLEILGPEVKALLKRGIDTAPAIVSAMQERHPRFNEAWLRRVRAADPSIRVRTQPRGPRGKGEARRADAQLLLAAMNEHEGLSVAAVARLLSPKHPRFRTPGYPYNLLSAFREELETPRLRYREEARNGLAMQELFRLISEIAPPGTSNVELGQVMDDLVTERGSVGGGDPFKVYTRYRNHVKGYEQPLERSARLFWDILHEYAAVAPKGTSQAEILARVRKDYPGLSPFRFGHYRRIWAGQGRALALAGQGRTLSAPRYLGGWDPLRALSAADELRLQRAVQFARMPLRLPLLDATLDDAMPNPRVRPLVHHNVLWVSHLLGSSYALSRTLVRAGMRTPQTIIVGTPYGTNEAVRAALEADGFDVRVPKLDEKAYRAAVKKGLDDILKKAGPIVVMDDGGFVADLLHTDPAYANLDRPITIVEQTTAGIRKAEARNLRFPVISVARSLAKQEESKLIGRAVAEKVTQGIGRLGRKIDGAKVVVMGGGWVGSATAERLRAQGADVAVLDPNVERQAAANPGRLRLPARDQLLRDADIVIGASGERSIGLHDLSLLKHGAVVLSASSKRVEIAMDELTRHATAAKSIGLSNRALKLRTVRYTLAGRDITVLGDGWPVNFDGDVEDIPADEIQLTRAAMLAGALQAVSVNPAHRKNHRVLALDAGVDAKLVERYHALRAGKPEGPIGDPDRWRDEVNALASRFGAEN